MSGLSVRTHGLVHIYRAEGHDVAALSGVDLTVAPGERIALLGPSGAGKSTLLALFGGLLRPSAGRIHVGEHELSGMSEAEIDSFRAGDVGIVLQGAARNHLPWLTVRGNLDFAQKPARRVGREVPAVEDLLDLLRLTEVADAPLERLTPGQLQLAALAVALACGPGLLLGDEPTSQLDHDSRDVVLDALAEVGRTLGTTIVVVTHDPDVAQTFPRTVTIRDGRVGGEGRSGEEYSVVAADGSLPLPAPALEAFPAGTLVRVHRTDDGTWLLMSDEEET
ncbi:MAG: ABC transporter ATP-binding protein [Janibacter sp.]